MQQQEQQTNRQQELKKAVIGSAVMLAVLTIGLILIVFSWFSVVESRAKAKGVSMIANDNLNISFNTYPGTVQTSGKIAYDERPEKDLNNPDYDEEENAFSMFPGERKYFKTVISNYELDEYTGAFTLQAVLVNKALVTTADKVCITFSSSLEDGTNQQSIDLEAAQTYYEDGAPSEVYSIVNTQPVFEHLTLDAATQLPGENVQPSTVIIYWYVVLNGDAVDNSVMGAQMMKFNRVKFFVN